MRHVGLRVVVVLLVVLGIAYPSVARMQYYTQFKKEYLDNLSDKDFAELVNKGTNKCFVCHQGKKSKKNRNAFGQEFAKLLGDKKDIKDKDAIVEGLKKAVALHVDPKDDKSETYLERIQHSKWPAGDLKELEREPADKKDDAEKKD